MSGHSRWSQIKHKKTISDQKRSQLFSKFVKLISIAAKEGTNPDANPKLKSAIEQAKSFNMPNENIKRAINKVKNAPEDLKELIIEVIGPANSSIIIEAITDNKNRTMTEIKSILVKNEAKIATPGSQTWKFNKIGVIRLIRPPLLEKNKTLSEENLELQIIEMGAEEIKRENDILEVYTKPKDFESIKNSLINIELEIESSGLEYVPKMPLKIDDDLLKQKFNNLFDLLDEHDDVSQIYSNLDL